MTETRFRINHTRRSRSPVSVAAAIGRFSGALQMFPVMVSATQTFKTHVGLFHSHKSDQAFQDQTSCLLCFTTAPRVFIGTYIFPLMTRRSPIFQPFILSAFQIQVSAPEGACTGVGGRNTRAHPSSVWRARSN